MRLARIAILSLTIFAFAIPHSRSFATEVSGKVAASMYNHDDDVSTHDYSIGRVRLKLLAKDILFNDSNFRLSGSVRSSSGDYNSSIPNQRIDTARLELHDAFSLLDINIGRQQVDEAPYARVDGGDIKLKLFKSSGVGMFGGLAPRSV